MSTVMENSPDVAERLEEFRQFCLKTGQDYKTMHLKLHGTEIEANLPLILKAAPDACFCASETYSVRLGQLLNAAGVRIPEDISLMGLEDRANAGFTPPITAIRQNFEHLAEVVAESMSEMLTAGTIPKNCRIPFILIERESVREPDKD